MDLKKTLKEKRPSLGDSSITTYSSILKNLHKKIFGEDKDFQLGNFQKEKLILSELKDLPPNKMKTILSALVVLTDSKTYRDAMMGDIKDYR